MFEVCEIIANQFSNYSKLCTIHRIHKDGGHREEVWGQLWATWSRCVLEMSSVSLCENDVSGSSLDRRNRRHSRKEKQKTFLKRLDSMLPITHPRPLCACAHHLYEFGVWCHLTTTTRMHFVAIFVM